MTNAQSIEQKLKSLIESNGGTFTLETKVAFALPDYGRPDGAFGFNLPKITKPTTLAASIVITFASPKIAHETLTFARDVIHDYYTKDHGKSMMVSDGKVTVTIQDSVDVETAIKLFERAKSIESSSKNPSGST